MCKSVPVQKLIGGYLFIYIRIMTTLKLILTKALFDLVENVHAHGQALCLRMRMHRLCAPLRIKNIQSVGLDLASTTRPLQKGARNDERGEKGGRVKGEGGRGEL